jgi:predicted Zn-dependent protease
LGIVGLRWTSRDWPRLFPNQSKTDPQIDNWFREAQQAYLQGHWIEAETLLAQLLKRQPADADARLLLASVQRRSGARKQARQTLTELQPVATRWHWEIAAELEQITELEEEKSTAAPQPQRKAA